MESEKSMADIDGQDGTRLMMNMVSCFTVGGNGVLSLDRLSDGARP